MKLKQRKNKDKSSGTNDDEWSSKNDTEMVHSECSEIASCLVVLQGSTIPACHCPTVERGTWGRHLHSLHPRRSPRNDGKRKRRTTVTAPSPNHFRHPCQVRPCSVRLFPWWQGVTWELLHPYALFFFLSFFLCHSLTLFPGNMLLREMQNLARFFSFLLSLEKAFFVVCFSFLSLDFPVLSYYLFLLVFVFNYIYCFLVKKINKSKLVILLHRIHELCFICLDPVWHITNSCIIPIQQGIQYKISTAINVSPALLCRICVTVFNFTHPPVLATLLLIRSASRLLAPGSPLLVPTPFPSWHDLPLPLWQKPSLDSFKCNLKVFLFTKP